ETPAMWLARIAPRPAGTEGAPYRSPLPGQDSGQLLGDKDGFAQAVRDALKNFHVPDALARNPLIHSALVAKSAGGDGGIDSRVRALQAAIAEVVEGLGTVPKRENLYQALRYTYLEPQGSQERVAEWLDLPF